MLRVLGTLLCTVCLVVPGAAQATVDAGSDLDRLEVPRDLRVVSYYPADAGWTRMWEPWRPQRLAADLRRLRWLNANTVRVVVPAHFFGYPEPEAKYLDRLSELVAIAARNGLHVQLTLFDWWGDYRDVEGSKQWARAVLEPYVGDPRIAFVELRNEIDTADADALAWTRELVPWLRDLLRATDAGDGLGRRQRAGATTCARSWRRCRPARGPTSSTRTTSPAAASRRSRSSRALRELRRADTALDRRARLSDVDNAQRLPGVPLTPSAQEAAQAHFFKLCFGALARLGLPAPGVWILDDFAPGRDSVIGCRRPGGGIPVRPLPWGRLGEAGGGSR